MIKLRLSIASQQDLSILDGTYIARWIEASSRNLSDNSRMYFCRKIEEILYR